MRLWTYGVGWSDETNEKQSQANGLLGDRFESIQIRNIYFAERCIYESSRLTFHVFCVDKVLVISTIIMQGINVYSLKLRTKTLFLVSYLNSVSHHSNDCISNDLLV